MRKFNNEVSDYLRTLNGFKNTAHAQREIVAQNGLGYNVTQPYNDPDRNLDVLKSFGAGYLGSRTFHNAYYTNIYSDPKQAEKKAKEAALFSGATGAVRTIFSQIKEQRDYNAEMERIRRQQAGNYYRVPVDNYSYNENLGNAYNNTGYKSGGLTHKKYQTGGISDPVLNPLGNPLGVQDTTAPYNRSVYQAPTMDAYDTAYRKSFPLLGQDSSELRGEYNILDASARLNMGLNEQTSTKTKSKVQPFVERKYGGMTKKRKVHKMRYQDGGEYDPEVTEREAYEPYEPYVQPSTEVFDATDGGYTPMDDLPMSEDGYDLSSFTPTLGGTPLSFDPARISSSVQDVIGQIAQHESGGRYDVINTSGGANAINATGKYQFVPKYWHEQIATFQGTQGKSMQETMDTFRRSPETQDSFMNHVVNDIYLPEVQNLLPMAKAYGLGQKELIKMLHYRGIADTRKRLQTGNFEISAKEKRIWKNPEILQYIKS